MTDVLRELGDAIHKRQAEAFWGDLTAAVTTDFRSRMLTQIGRDPDDTPAGLGETVFGIPMTVDDAIPADPGFEIRTRPMAAR